jgi:hypothetical protein
MCHHVNVYAALSAEDKKAAKAVGRLLVPVYASIVLAAIALVAVGSAGSQKELIASSSASAATH